MTSQEIETWISENRPEPPRGSAVCCAASGGTESKQHPKSSAPDGSADDANALCGTKRDGCGSTLKKCSDDCDLSRPNRHRFEAEGVSMKFVSAVDYDHLCHKYDEVCQQLRESEAARGEQMRTIEVLAAEVRAWRECVEADPIYGWSDPRKLESGSDEWLHVGQTIANTNAHPPARRLVEEDSNG